jgi:hypothetical protein
MLGAVRRANGGAALMQRRWMSSAPNLLAALQAKGTVLHVELKAANEQ